MGLLSDGRVQCLTSRLEGHDPQKGDPGTNLHTHHITCTPPGKGKARQMVALCTRETFSSHHPHRGIYHTYRERESSFYP